MQYYISRQCYWPDGEHVVEIAAGGLDYANPDMLVSGKEYRKLGCDEEYTDPRLAIASAINIRKIWNKVLSSDNQARVETGCTGGMTMPFGSYPTDEELTQWAIERWEALPKCDQCEDRITGESYRHIYDSDWEFCSEYCVEQWHYQNWEVEVENEID